ncbi:unnamed protein product, partial [Ectocarpus sp. 12 AP-2014]
SFLTLCICERVPILLKVNRRIPCESGPPQHICVIPVLPSMPPALLNKLNLVGRFLCSFTLSGTKTDTKHTTAVTNRVLEAATNRRAWPHRSKLVRHGSFFLQSS